MGVDRQLARANAELEDARQNIVQTTQKLKSLEDEMKTNQNQTKNDLDEAKVELKAVKKEFYQLKSERIRNSISNYDLSFFMGVDRQLARANAELEDAKKNIVELAKILSQVYKVVPENDKEPREFMINVQDSKRRDNEMSSLLQRIRELKIEKQTEKDVREKLYSLRDTKVFGIDTKDRPVAILTKVIQKANEECKVNDSLKNQNKILETDVKTLKQQNEVLLRQKEQAEATRDEYASRLEQLQQATPDESLSNLSDELEQLRQDRIRESIQSEIVTELLLTKYAARYPIFTGGMFGKSRS